MAARRHRAVDIRRARAIKLTRINLSKDDVKNVLIMKDVQDVLIMKGVLIMKDVLIMKGVLMKEVA